MVLNLDSLNINQNLLPIHAKTNILELVPGIEVSIVSYKPIIKIKINVEKWTNDVDLTKEKSSSVNEMLVKPKTLNTLMIIIEVALEIIGESEIKQKSIIQEFPPSPSYLLIELLSHLLL